MWSHRIVMRLGSLYCVLSCSIVLSQESSVRDIILMARAVSPLQQFISIENFSIFEYGCLCTNSSDNSQNESNSLAFPLNSGIFNSLSAKSRSSVNRLLRIELLPGSLSWLLLPSPSLERFLWAISVS